MAGQPLNWVICKWLRDMRVKKSAFTPTPICIVVKQVNAEEKWHCRQILNSLILRKLVRGFTLVELLVVISIIAILMGILMPALAAAKRSAYKTACKQNLHGLAIAFRMYLDDNHNIMPIIFNMPNSTVQEDANSVSLYASIGKYISGKEALKCPADRYPEKGTSYWKEEGSSYEYNSRHLNGKRIEDDWFAKRFGTNEVWILRDYDGFHGKKTGDNTWSSGSYMYLYADTLVADREREK
jgi:prepilin-type N-terminal cleavage/methylation domain-containing protein